MLGVFLLLVITIGISLYKENTKPFEPPNPIVKTEKQKIDVYFGFNADPKLGPSNREKRTGETIKRALDMEKPNKLSEKENTITVEFPSKRSLKSLQIIKIPVSEDTSIPSKEIMVAVSKEKTVFFTIPKEDKGTFKYIIRAKFTTGYTDYGFLIKKDS